MSCELTILQTHFLISYSKIIELLQNQKGNKLLVLEIYLFVVRRENENKFGVAQNKNKIVLVRCYTIEDLSGLLTYN